MSRNMIFFTAAALLLWLAPAARAHTPFMACHDNGDGTVTCFGEFSDGAPAARVSMQVVDEAGDVLFEGRMDEDGEYAFEKPETAYTVIFDAGPGHVVKEKSRNIE